MNAMTKHWVPIGNLEDIPLRGARCVKKSFPGFWRELARAEAGRSVPRVLVE